MGTYTESFDEPTQLEGVVSKKGKERVLTHPNAKHVQLKGRPNPRPLKQVEPHAAASKPASDFGDSDDSGTHNKTLKPQQFKLPKLKPSKPKSQVVKVKELLKKVRTPLGRLKKSKRRHRRW